MESQKQINDFLYQQVKELALQNDVLRLCCVSIFSQLLVNQPAPIEIADNWFAIISGTAAKHAENDPDPATAARRTELVESIYQNVIWALSNTQEI